MKDNKNDMQKIGVELPIAIVQTMKRYKSDSGIPLNKQVELSLLDWFHKRHIAVMEDRQ